MTSVETANREAPENFLVNESKKIARGGVVVMLGTIIAQALGMVTTIWIARELGPDQYGLLSLALSTLLPLTTLAAIGMHKTVVRYIPIQIGNRENSQIAGTLFSSLLMVAAASAVTVLVVYVLAPILSDLFHDERLVPLLRVLAITIPFSAIAMVAASATRGLKVMHFDAIVKIANPLFRLLVWSAGVLLMANMLYAAVNASLIGTILTAIVAIAVAVWGFREFLGDGIQWTYKPLLAYSMPLILSTMMYSLSPRMDRFVLGIVADVSAVGIYSAAASLILILTLVHSSITMTFAPIVADAYNRISINRAQSLYVSVTRWDARLTSLVVIVSILVAPELLWLFGASYAEALLPFVILAISVFVTTIAGPTGAFLQMTNRQRLDAINALIFFVVSPLIQFGFALWLGWVGVAVGVLATSVLINVLQALEIQYYYHFNPFTREHVLFTILSLVIMILAAVLSLEAQWPLRLFVLIVVLGAYAAFIYHFRTASDALILNALLPKRRTF